MVTGHTLKSFHVISVIFLQAEQRVILQIAIRIIHGIDEVVWHELRPSHVLLQNPQIQFGIQYLLILKPGIDLHGLLPILQLHTIPQHQLQAVIINAVQHIIQKTLDPHVYQTRNHVRFLIEHELRLGIDRLGAYVLLQAVIQDM